MEAVCEKSVFFYDFVCNNNYYNTPRDNKYYIQADFCHVCLIGGARMCGES